MHRPLRLCFVLLTLVSLAALAQAPGFTPGQNYFLVQPAQPTNAPPGKVEVTEVFSYACPACNQFEPVMDRLKANLPSNVVLNYVAAAFNPSEDWPVFQRCYYTAQALGIAERTQDAMFDAVWKTGELAVVEQRTNRLRNPLPTVEDCADFYQRTTGVSKQQFLATAKSFTVDTRIRRADALVLAYRADSTPTIIINGKYRLTPTSAGGYNQALALIKYLVTMESH
jgi:protein dithiol oxidoreductase (disulfide-forming)